MPTSWDKIIFPTESSHHQPKWWKNQLELHGLEQPNLFSHALDNVTKYYVKVANAISSFVEPTPPTNIITNETILNQYSIKQKLNSFDRKIKDEVQKEFQQIHDNGVVEPKNPQDLS